MSQAAADHFGFLDTANAEYIAHLYSEFLKSPASVDASWQAFFGGLNDVERDVLGELSGASWTPVENKSSARAFGSTSDGAAPVKAMAPAAGGGVSDAELQQATNDTVRALGLIRGYRSQGHMEAKLDPLGMRTVDACPELDPKYYGFTPDEYDRPIYIGGFLGFERASVNEILTTCRALYSGKIGFEYMHISSMPEREWLQAKIEKPENKPVFDASEKKMILESLTKAEGLEKFIAKKHPGTKRFGIDGGESLIPAIEEIIGHGAKMGLEEVTIGMAHRGRLNVLANILGKSYTAIFAEFDGAASKPEDVSGSGDVKYHLGASNDRDFGGNMVHLSLNPNPSHLEFVNPVVTGKVRAKQAQRGEIEDMAVMPMILHGDAAFAGQGVTAETLMIAELPGYRVGGTVHIVINNQIGFTTMPKFGRSGPYSTDVAKMLEAPIFHVNGDDPEAVVHIARLAAEYRQTFKKDVVVDMYCYRRFGHNEGDEPAFTQPLMYKQIAEQKSTREMYEERLVSEGSMTADDVQAVTDAFTSHLDGCFEDRVNYKPDADFFGGVWEGLKLPEGGARRGDTGIKRDEADVVAKAITTVPDGFEMNRKLKRVVDARAKMIAGEQRMDWATAEALAYGTLVNEGFGVRLSGQDVGRGTFSQRHATWYDQNTNEKYMALQNVSDNQGKFEAHDSPLSEMAVMGFEYGFSLADPKTLTLWEAQFGDFANGAQVIIDQFIASGEIKWLRMSGLVLLLPHGFEGQGPEHSSGRLERFLQLSAEDNWQVCNITTPANYFHVLRRQLHRDFRKPLIIVTPKSLLRHKLATSDVNELLGDTTFHRVLWDDDKDTELVAPEKIKRVVLCTGKVYYDLLQTRRDKGIDDVYLMRVEQLYPFPEEGLTKELEPFVNADIVWCQEEPENQGAWHFVDRRIEGVLRKMGHKAERPKYVGRSEAASVATGSASVHAVEQAALVNEALTV